jgi:putative ABC transport system permease protein
MRKSLRTGFFLAARSIARGNYGIAAMTVFMILLVYVDLLFLPALIQGAVDRINSQIVDTYTSDIVIKPAGQVTRLGGAGAYLSEIRHTSGVASATAVYRVGNQVSYGANSGSWAVDAIDPESYREVFTTPANIFEGSYLTERDASKVFLGIGIAGAGQPKVRGYKGSLRIVRPGDRVAVTLTSGRVTHFTVSGIYQNKFPLSDQTAFITMHEAEQLEPAVNDHATAIYVRTTPGTSDESMVSQLKPLKSGVQFETSATLASASQDQIATFNLISNILKVVSLLVAAITVFIVTYVDLVNKRRQIGIERAIGIRSAAIVTSYVVKASCYAIIGIGAGLACFNYVIVPLVRHRPFQFPNGPVALASTWQQIRQNLIILIIVALVSAAIPAIRSVRIKILDAIWEK